MALQDPAQEIVYKLFDMFIELQQARLSLLANNRNLGNVVYEEKSNKKTGKALKELLEYSKIKGNHLEYDSISPEDSGLFREILKSKRILFTEAKMYDSKLDSDRHVFITKDTDRPIVNEVRNKFRYELNIGIGELRASDFAKMNENQLAYSTDGLTRAELEMFRYNAVIERVSYSVMEQNDGSYSVLYTKRDADYIKRALSLSSFDVSGDSGHKLIATINETLEKQRLFAKNMYPPNGHVKYIVDSVDPAKFICVSDHGYSTHTLNIKKNSVSDSCGIVSNDYSNLLTLVSELENAVILSENQMEYIKGVNDTTCEALTSDISDFGESFARTLETISNNNDTYKTLQISTLIDKSDSKTREDFLSNINCGNAISDREKEAAERLDSNWITKEYRIDRSFIEKAMTLDNSPKKIVTEKHKKSHSQADTGHSL